MTPLASPSSAGISQGGSGITRGALIEDNVIYDNGFSGGAAINLDGVQQSRIQNNLLYGNHATGIALFRQDGAAGSSSSSSLSRRRCLFFAQPSAQAVHDRLGH